LSVIAPPALHMPDEPTAHAARWLTEVLEGQDLAAVLRAEGGVVEWLWSRWSALRQAGITKAEFEGIVLGYRREIWLWLAGERVWSQCCAGLIGRVGRRIGQGTAADS
jgi:hypothetical protein